MTRRSKPRPATISSWHIYLARHSPAKWIGTVEAVDAGAAIAEAVQVVRCEGTAEADSRAATIGRNRVGHGGRDAMVGHLGAEQRRALELLAPLTFARYCRRPSRTSLTRSDASAAPDRYPGA